MKTDKYIKIVLGGGFLILILSWVKKLIPDKDEKKELQTKTDEVTVESINNWFNRQNSINQMRMYNNVNALEDILNQVVIFENGIREAFSIATSVQSCEEYAYYNAVFEDKRAFEDDTLDTRLREVGQDEYYPSLELHLETLCK